MRSIKKILVANRGEIAVRIMRTCADMGISSVAVYSDADKNAVFVKKADEAIHLPGVQAADTYLNHDKIIGAAKVSGADAIHAGYGFLSENASFAARCKNEGIVFIGPTPEVIAAMGSKTAAKETAIKAGVPVVPGYQGKDFTYQTLLAEADKIGYPVLLKASAGGGGKGIRIVHKAEDLEAASESASREALKSFGDGSLLLEKYFPWAKHIEFQIFGDKHGNYTHFFERECSLQRRYQKVIEESPSPSLTPELRKRMGATAVAAAKSINYTNAGTVEFILDKQGNFYFLEVNTRLQVEHPVTEETTGLDLVRLQIEIAQGLPLKVNSENIQQKGHSIECRICAEDSENNFFPSTGNIIYYHEPALKGLRYDSGVASGSNVDVFYDSLISKVIATGKNRDEAVARMLHALNKMSVLGITTNKDFVKELLQHPSFLNGSFDTKLIEREFAVYKKKAELPLIHQLSMAALLYGWNERKENEKIAHSLNGWRNIFYQPQTFQFEIEGQTISIAYRYEGESKFEVWIDEMKLAVELAIQTEHSLIFTINNHRQEFFIAQHDDEFYVHHPYAGTFRFKQIPRFSEPGKTMEKGSYAAPMPGEIVKILVKPGEAVKSGKGLLVMSSMKMETTIEAHSDGEVEEILVTEKSFVDAHTVLLRMKQGA
jgi:acetyl-CoA carboxylase biotin carboxylase subunit